MPGSMGPQCHVRALAHTWPMRGKYSSHMITFDQSESGLAHTWPGYWRPLNFMRSGGPRKSTMSNYFSSARAAQNKSIVNPISSHFIIVKGGGAECDSVRDIVTSWQPGPAPCYNIGPGLILPLTPPSRHLLWLVMSDHMTWVLASDWSRVIRWPVYWPLVGRE